MKKKLFALSGVFLIALVITGLWATKAISFTDESQAIQSDSAATSQAVGMSVEELTGEAATIVRGKCLETRSQWVERRAYTLATISVMQTLKGDASETVTVAMPGGFGSNGKFKFAVTIAGVPTITRDDEFLFFLTKHDDIEGGYAVAGFTDGMYSIFKDEADNEFAARDQTRVRMPQGTGVTRGTRQAIPLPELIERVRRALDK